MPIGYRQFLEMLKAHPEANTPEDLIALYPDVPADDIRAAWESMERFMEWFREVFAPSFKERYGSDVERIIELEELLPFPEENLRKASFTEMLEARDGMEAIERLGVMLSGAPKQEKRGPGRPSSPSRIAAYNFIRSGRMSRKQAFDWWLEQAGVEPVDEDDYQTRFKSFKNAYRAWKSDQKRKASEK